MAGRTRPSSWNRSRIDEYQLEGLKTLYEKAMCMTMTALFMFSCMLKRSGELALGGC